MYKKLGILFVAILVAVPTYALADTPNSDQLVALYQQLVQILQQELVLLQHPSGPTLSITPSSGKMPLSVTFTVNDPTGTEGIDFGDGHSTGSNGCVKNAKGFCDLSQPISHTYLYPAAYSVKLYSQPAGTSSAAVVANTATVTVTQ